MSSTDHTGNAAEVPTAAEVLGFWFDECSPDAWFMGGPEFDALVQQRLSAGYEAATRGDLDTWSDTPDGCLALCILLDQAPRNMFRRNPKAFATDEKALGIALHAIEQGFDLKLPTDEHRLFLYTPLEHAEDLAHQDRCVELMQTRMPTGDYAKWAVSHREIIAKFGRFPHRNEVLGRAHTSEEAAWLAEGGARFGQ